MKTTKFVLLLSAPIFIAYACCLSSDVTVINFSPEGKVNQLTKFTVEFSYNVAPIEKQNQWLTDQFIEFEPKIQSKFKWWYLLPHFAPLFSLYSCSAWRVSLCRERIVGHEDLSTNQIYSHLQKENLYSAISLFNCGWGFYHQQLLLFQPVKLGRMAAFSPLFQPQLKKSAIFRPRVQNHLQIFFLPLNSHKLLYSSYI